MKKKVQPASEPFDYELAKQKVKEQLRSGKSLFGKDGAFAPLFAGNAELDPGGRDGGTWMRKNGYSSMVRPLSWPISEALRLVSGPGDA